MSGFLSRRRIRALVFGVKSARLANVELASGKHELLSSHQVISKKLLADWQGNDSAAHFIARSSYDIVLDSTRKYLKVPEEGRFHCTMVRTPSDA
jgi:hypothetical protein